MRVLLIFLGGVALFVALVAVNPQGCVTMVVEQSGFKEQIWEAVGAKAGIDRLRGEADALEARLNKKVRSVRTACGDMVRAAAWAEVRTAEGRVFRNVRVSSTDADGVGITHADGSFRLDYSALPPYWRTALANPPERGNGVRARPKARISAVELARKTLGVEEVNLKHLKLRLVSCAVRWRQEHAHAHPEIADQSSKIENPADAYAPTEEIQDLKVRYAAAIDRVKLAKAEIEAEEAAAKARQPR